MQAKQFKLIEKRNLWFFLSVGVILFGLLTMSYRAIKHQPSLNFGIDFTGGSSFMMTFDRLDKLYEMSSDAEGRDEINIAFIQSLRSVLKRFGLEKSQIQITQDREIVIKTVHLENKTRRELLARLEESTGQMTLLEIDIIGPSIGEELKRQSFWIILVVSLGLLFYIWWRFDLIYGAAALIAVLHDTLIVISLASLLKIEINTAFVAAILTVLGYSINDTIVIFDRIRENTHLSKGKQVFKSLLNLSISQMISRSIHTSSTTLIVVLCLFIFGGTTIKAFTLVLLIGIVTGTYSSIFIASPVLYLLHPEDG